MNEPISYPHPPKRSVFMKPLIVVVGCECLLTGLVWIVYMSTILLIFNLSCVTLASQGKY